jgi:hypothetical protein
MQFSDHSRLVQWAIVTATTPEETEQIIKAEDYGGIEIDFNQWCPD